MIQPFQRISIPSILKVGNQNLYKVGSILKRSEITNVTVLFGDGIESLFGSALISSLSSNQINILKIYNFDNTEVEKIVELAFSLPSQTEAVIAIGGGKVLDVAKYICYLKQLKFISIPTSASNDGFASSTCSLIVNGRRTSVPAKIPYGVIVDLDIIKSAPEKFIYSGIGDLISKITALYDWKFEEEHGKSIVNDASVLIAKKSVNSFVRTDFRNIKEDFFLKELVDSLIMNGIAVEIAQSSAPTSGSEHLISHALDKILEHPQLHGIQVGIATYIMSIVQNHRSERVLKVLTNTGFFEYVKSLNMKKSDFEKAIDIAPSIKPNRFTCIHSNVLQQKAKDVLYNDLILSKVLI